MATKLRLMAGEPQLPPACVSDVLDNQDLLTEIILRVVFPSSLVRAAGVCRRWFRLVSDQAFLRRFRKLHPPRLLGFYLVQRSHLSPSARFFPMLRQRPPLELAEVVRPRSFWWDIYAGTIETDMVGCWNGRVVFSGVVKSLHVHNEVRREIVFLVHSPLCSERGMAVMPALQFPFLEEGGFYSYIQLFSNEESHVLTYFYVMVEAVRDRTKSIVHVYMLQNGDHAWRKHFTLVVDYLFHTDSPSSVLVDNKIYLESANKIFVLDLTASSSSIIQLPQGVDFNIEGTTMLSRAHDTHGVYLIHAKKHQLHIWLYKAGNWLLKDNICLREMCATLLEHEPPALIEINHVGNYSNFVFLKIGRCALHLDVKGKTLQKVYEMPKEDQNFGRIHPFMMPWRPIFPSLKDGHARFAT